MKAIDKFAFVTGAFGNLGRVIIDELASMGMNLVLTDKDIDGAESFIAEIKKKYSVEAIYIYSNLEFESERSNLIRQIKSNIGVPAVMVNNAAFVGDTMLPGWACNLGDQSLESWRRAMEVNLTAPFHLIRDFYADYPEGSSNVSIINVASIYGQHAPNWDLYEGLNMANPAAYSVSKAGLIYLTRWMATTLKSNVRVNAVAPGGIYRNQPDLFVSRYVNRVPLKRMATEEDMRGIFSYLASAQSAYVTGQCFDIDGGWGLW